MQREESVHPGQSKLLSGFSNVNGPTLVSVRPRSVPRSCATYSWYTAAHCEQPDRPPTPIRKLTAHPVSGSPDIITRGWMASVMVVVIVSSVSRYIGGLANHNTYGTRWPSVCMSTPMKERYLAALILISLALAVLGSIGAFFLAVPILPTIAGIAILMGLVAMFGLGFYLGKDTESPDRVEAA
jgi:hypothetical protein